MRSTPVPRLRRRTAAGAAVLAALAGSGVLFGCDIDDVLDRPAADPPAPEPDEVLVDEVAAAVTSARTLAARLPGAEAWVTLHDAHLAGLGTTPPASAPTSPSGSASATLAPAAPSDAELRSTEAALQQTLAAAAVRAEDGALARTLAAMSAGVAQQLAAGGAR